MDHPVTAVQRFGQSIWYDSIRRGFITSGELHALISEGGVLGVTSNPAIFEKAVAGSNDYDQALRALVRQDVGDAKDLYERLAIEDIQLAADVLHDVYERTQARDGYVSLEVSPYLASDTEATVEEALRLHAAIGRENVMIKVPATDAGYPAIRRLIGEGISVNATLIFAIDSYERVADAYISGLEDAAATDRDLSRIAGVASIFISRIDSAIDQQIEAALDATRDAASRRTLKSLVGKIAIANAVIAYARMRELLGSERWKALESRGGQPQRLLWASTGTKNPKYPRTMYVDELIGPHTVNTLPAETYRAFLASGTARSTLTEDWERRHTEAREIVDRLGETGISLDEVMQSLLEGGLKSFSDAFDRLLGAVEKKRQWLLGGELAQHSQALGEAEEAVEEVLEDWRKKGNVRRLWSSDPSLWSGADEDRWLGWLHVVEAERDQAQGLGVIARGVKEDGFRHLVLLGMGGSSLCPDVLRATFGRIADFPELLVLDSVVPSQVRSIEAQIDPARTLFIVSSKSGGTTETRVLQRYFMDKVRAKVGDEAAGSHFLAITDPGTRLQAMAKSGRFRQIVYGDPEIGGRYSALSNFGLVPAALMGIDVHDFLERAEIMVQACESCVPPTSNPGVMLGVIMGTLALRGRDKVTIFNSPGIGLLGAWLEQLIAESTGKRGLGLVPVADEQPGPPEVYSEDRLFIYSRLTTDDCPELERAVERLEAAGHPVVRLSIDDPMDLGQAFFRWEVATAVAGALLGINPFDQPDVEAAKIATRRLTEAYEETGELPAASPIARGRGVELYADEKGAEILRAAAGSEAPETLIAAHLARIRPGDYFAINAFLEVNETHQEQLQALRHAVRDAKRVATTLGYGPRFLHSTGQLHKGGPNSGVFLQITSDDAEDLAIAGQKATFGLLKQAQALGDFEVLAERGRRVLRIHLEDPHSGLVQLRKWVEDSLR